MRSLACDSASILSELEALMRDPGPEFKTATFRDGIESVSDFQPVWCLRGVVARDAQRQRDLG